MNSLHKGRKRKIISQTIALLIWDWPTLLLFEMLYKFFLFFLTQAMLQIFNLALKGAKIPYLTSRNLGSFLSSPRSWIIIISLLLLLAVSGFIEISGIIIYCEWGRLGTRKNAFVLSKAALKQSLHILKPRNFPILFLLLVAFPLSGFTFSSGPFRSLNIPEFIYDFIQHYKALSLCFFLFILGLEILVLFRIFAIPEFVLNHTSFKTASKKSRSLLKGRKWKTALSIFLFFVIAFLAGFLFLMGTSLCLILITRLVSKDSLIFWYQLAFVQAACEFITTILTVSAAFTLITILYHEYGGSPPQNRSLHTPESNFGTRSKRLVLYIPVLIILLSLYGETTFLNGSLYISDDAPIEVVAHRGGALLAPENTLAALDIAISSGAEYAEIDVQQTKDKELIVLHDTNYKRIAGISKYVWETTYEECQRYNAGNGERIPTLEEMIIRANGNIKLMIELKNNGRQAHMTEKVIQLIQKHHFDTQCYIASMDYELLKEAKELAPQIETVFITAVAYGNFKIMDAADILSVESTFALPKLKKELDAAGKPLYVWTVNSKASLMNALSLRPKGIITDDPYWAQDMLDTKGQNSLLNKLADMILDLPDTLSP